MDRSIDRKHNGKICVSPNKKTSQEADETRCKLVFLSHLDYAVEDTNLSIVHLSLRQVFCYGTLLSVWVNLDNLVRTEPG